MKFSTVFLLILTSGFFLMSGCNKESNNDPDLAYLQFHTKFNVDGEALEFNKNYQVNGTTMKFIAANYYLGGLKLTQASGNVIDFTNQYLLAGLGGGAVVNEPVEFSNITNIKFFVGVDSITNKMSELDFTSRPANDPLGMQDPSMHWGWNSGYRFLRIDGLSDTDGDGNPETPVEYHLGSNPMLKNIDLSVNIEVKAGENILNFNFNLARFFDGVDVTTELVTHVGDNLPLAVKIRDNLPAALTVE